MRNGRVVYLCPVNIVVLQIWRRFALEPILLPEYPRDEVMPSRAMSTCC